VHPFPDDDEIVWRPTPALVEQAVLTAFQRRLGVADRKALQSLAAEAPDRFWAAVMEDLAWPWRRPPEAILDLGRGKPWPRWFPGGVTNLVDAIVRPERRGVALRWEGEDGSTAELTYPELGAAVRQAAGGLRKLGIGPGDRVGLFLPMLPETAVALLAVAALGAIAVPIFSGYGAEAVATRLADAGAVALITADGFLRRGRAIPMLETAQAARAATAGVRHLIAVPRLGRPLPADVVPWPAVASGEPVAPEAVPADHPFLLIYTSGTTGRPKGAVHSHTGFPVKAAQDLRHAFDLRADDTLFWFTDIGWMMGPWAILGAGVVGATCLLYEGTPDHPGPDRLWALLARHRVSVFGLSPTVIRALMPHGEEPVRRHDLGALRVLGSTGEPWNPEAWRWFFRVVGGTRLPIINYSGGTETSGGILGCFVTEPLKPCAFTGPLPGMQAVVLDEAGRPVTEAVGELAVTLPWVGMTHGFWGDPERYLDTYWRRFPDVWVHGDFAYVDADGYTYILGRSDDTIKVAGKRLGPAEAEAAAASLPAVREALAIGVPDPVKGEVLVLFVVPSRTPAPEALAARVAERVAAVLGPALRPQAVHVVDDLPRTRNGKILRRVARAAYLGRPPGDLSALENPAAVEVIAELGRRA
jgi:acetyl-CoA synthetase